MRFRRVLGAAMVAVLATSCSLGSPEDAGSVNVYVELDKGNLALGDSVTITVLARNVGSDPVALIGPSDCLLYVEAINAIGQVAWHSNVNCSPSAVTEPLVAGTDRVQTFIWKGTGLDGLRVNSGFYSIRGAARVVGGAYVGPALSIAVE